MIQWIVNIERSIYWKALPTLFCAACGDSALPAVRNEEQTCTRDAGDSAGVQCKAAAAATVIRLLRCTKAMTLPIDSSPHSTAQNRGSSSVGSTVAAGNGDAARRQRLWHNLQRTSMVCRLGIVARAVLISTRSTSKCPLSRSRGLSRPEGQEAKSATGPYSRAKSTSSACNC